MKDAVRYRHGLVCGRFYPPHEGHHRLIETAAARCARATVAVLASPEETIPLASRVAWMRSAHAGQPYVRIVGDHGDPPFDPALVEAAVARATIEDRLPPPAARVDAVFTARPEGDDLSRPLGATLRRVAPERRGAPAPSSPPPPGGGGEPGAVGPPGGAPGGARGRGGVRALVAPAGARRPGPAGGRDRLRVDRDHHGLPRDRRRPERPGRGLGHDGLGGGIRPRLHRGEAGGARRPGRRRGPEAAHHGGSPLDGRRLPDHRRAPERGRGRGRRRGLPRARLRHRRLRHRRLVRALPGIAPPRGRGGRRPLPARPLSADRPRQRPLRAGRAARRRAPAPLDDPALHGADGRDRTPLDRPARLPGRALRSSSGRRRPPGCGWLAFRVTLSPRPSRIFQRRRSFMRVQLVISSLLTLVLVAAPGRALEKPQLLADIVRGGDPDAPLSSPGDFIQAGSRLLFSTLGYGDEGILWSTDGTAAGTGMVSSSLCPVGCTGIHPVGS